MGAIEKGALTEREGQQVRANYGAKLTMIDHWLGEILDAVDEHDLWADTAVIVCTDHGHYLGDVRDGHDLWGKPGVMQYEPLGHTPLFIAWPGAEEATVDALSTNVDIHATVADIFDVHADHVTHGRSLRPLLEGEATTVRDWALGGVYGNWVQITDGHTKYARAPEGENFPLSMWSNRWSTMPIRFAPGLRLPRPDKRATLDFMPGSEVPVIRQPFAPSDPLPYWVARYDDEHHLYNVDDDPDEGHDRAGSDPHLEAEFIDLLRTGLSEVDAPSEHYERLGIA